MQSTAGLHTDWKGIAMTQTPQVPPPLTTAVDREYLRTIAKKQKGLLICILAYVVMLVCRFILPIGLQPLWGIVAIPVVICVVVFTFMLATKVYSTGIGILLAVLTLIPLVGLFILMIVNGKATKILKSNGINVGFMGADTSAI